MKDVSKLGDKETLAEMQVLIEGINELCGALTDYTRGCGRRISRAKDAYARAAKNSITGPESRKEVATQLQDEIITLRKEVETAGLQLSVITGLVATGVELGDL